MDFVFFFYVLVPLLMYLGLCSLPQGRVAFIACSVCFLLVLPLLGTASNGDTVTASLLTVLSVAIASAGLVQWLRLHLSPMRSRARYAAMVLFLSPPLVLTLLVIVSPSLSAKEVKGIAILSDFGTDTWWTDRTVLATVACVGVHEIQFYDFEGCSVRRKGLRGDDGATKEDPVMARQDEQVWKIARTSASSIQKAWTSLPASSPAGIKLKVLPAKGSLRT